MAPVVHTAPKAENTLLGRMECLVVKKFASLRGQIGSRLDLSIQELPSLGERERVCSVLEQLCLIQKLSPVSSNLYCLLQDIHQALLEPSLRERHSTFQRAIHRIESSEPLTCALATKFEPPDEIADYEDVVNLSYVELSAATRSLRDLVWWARHGHFHQSRQVANHLTSAHRWIFTAGGNLFWKKPKDSAGDE